MHLRVEDRIDRLLPKDIALREGGGIVDIACEWVFVGRWALAFIVKLSHLKGVVQAISYVVVRR